MVEVAVHLSRREYWCYISTMTAAPAPLSLAPDLPFKYVAGDPALDLVNTVDWTSRGPGEDRLTDYGRLTTWAEGAGILLPRLGASFRARATERPRAASNALREATRLRWVLRQVFRAVAHGERVTPLALGELNDALSGALSQLQLVGSAAPGGEAPAMLWSWKDAADRLDSIAWPVVRSAAELLASDEAGRIRECGGPECGWIYVDRSRNGLRRWCEMESCGTREKSRRRATRKNAAR
jgi:predicted RNA-binding Zn ribbon-like protein